MVLEFWTQTGILKKYITGENKEMCLIYWKSVLFLGQ